MSKPETVRRFRCGHCGTPAQGAVYCAECAEDLAIIDAAKARILRRKREREKRPELDA